MVVDGLDSKLARKQVAQGIVFNDTQLADATGYQFHLSRDDTPGLFEAAKFISSVRCNFKQLKTESIVLKSSSGTTNLLLKRNSAEGKLEAYGSRKAEFYSFSNARASPENREDH